MVVLTDLPDELLLSIVAGVSPLYIESFALSCKRLHGLCAELIREHDRIRSKIPTDDPYLVAQFAEPSERWPYNLLGRFFQNPSLAEYPTSLHLKSDPINDAPEELIAEINTHTLRGPHAHLFDTEKSRPNAAQLVIPLMITRLLNLRKMEMNADYYPDLINFMSKIIKTSHDPILSLQEPLILGRLKEVEIRSHTLCSGGAELALLLSMLPSLKKLHVYLMLTKGPYVCPHKYHDSGVTDIVLDGQFDSEFNIELIRRTKSLQNFTYGHWIEESGVKLEPRRLLPILKKRARQSLVFLCLVIREDFSLISDCVEKYPKYDLSLGSLREFTVMKYLVTGVDMFIKTRGSSETHCGTGTVQRLVSWLPASLETLVLFEGLRQWNADNLRMLFRGFRNQKQLRLPNLKHIKFYGFHMVDEVMPDAIKVACRETGVTMSYTNDACFISSRHGHGCLQDWEDHPWIEVLETVVGPNSGSDR